MIKAFIGLGSNLSNPVQQVLKAIQILSERLTLLGSSSLYKTAPVGCKDQPEYINAVAEVETNCPPLDLLETLLAIEASMGRKRTKGVRMEERIIDLDLLLYGNQTISLPSLTVPHPRLHQRAFVLRPLHELQPDWILPGGRAVADLMLRKVVRLQKVECLDGVAVL